MVDARLGRLCGEGLEIGFVKYDGRAPGSLGFRPHLKPEGVAEVPLDQAGHGPRVGSALEQAGVPLFGAVESIDGAVRENAVDHGGCLPKVIANDKRYLNTTDGKLQVVAAMTDQEDGGRAVTSTPRSGCPINAAVEVLGDRWSLIVLRDIMFGDRRYFRTLQRESEEGIVSNILASRLRDLVAAGLLTREDPGAGRRAAYSLTESAIQLVPVLAELGWWGLQHRPTTEALGVRAQLLHDGGTQLWNDFMDELRERHLSVPAPSTGRPSVSEQLDAVYARATDTAPHTS